MVLSRSTRQVFALVVLIVFVSITIAIIYRSASTTLDAERFAFPSPIATETVTVTTVKETVHVDGEIGSGDNVKTVTTSVHSWKR